MIEDVFRRERSRVLATTIRVCGGDFDLAEEVVQEAFVAAVEAWSSGLPDEPRAWLMGVARHKAIDAIRRRVRYRDREAAMTLEQQVREELAPEEVDVSVPDDRLRLVFTCCHPALAREAQVALTLRTLCGLETDEIARAFLVPETTMAQRIVRAKKKIRDAGIPYAVPETNAIGERLEAVLTVIYLVFNEGYAATRSGPLVRTDLCAEAIRLGRLVRVLTGPQTPPEATALLALMLLQDARKDARLDAAGDLVTLEEQDRGLWNRAQIAEALPMVEEALRGGIGPLAIQAAISAVHCEAARMEDTDWAAIQRLYDLLLRVQPSPVVRLNRAVAVAMAEGPRAGLALIDELAAGGELGGYHLLHAARADLLRRMGEAGSAAESYRRALALVTNDSERRFLERRLREVELPVQ